MGPILFGITLAALSDCDVARVAPDPMMVSGKPCFDWSGADAVNESLHDIRALYQRLGNISARDLKVVNPVCNWDSARLTSIVINVILREIMGYKTELDFIGGTSMLYECVADKTHTFNAETWVNTKADQRKIWAEEQV
jgi:hypothetical protein